MNKLKIRGLKAYDIDYITSTWLRNYRNNSNFGKNMPKGIYFEEHHKLVHECLTNSRTLIACDPNDEEHVFGYIVGHNEPHQDVFHYAYVKGKLRRNGVFKGLVKEFKASDRVLHTHEDKKSILDSFYSEIIYNPYIFLKGE